LRKAVRRLRDSLRGAVASFDRARRRATRTSLEARVLGLAESAYFVHVREVAAGRELRDPDDVEALRRRLMDREPRRPPDDEAVRDLLPWSSLGVHRPDLRGEARGVR